MNQTSPAQPISIAEAVLQLRTIVKRLRVTYPDRKFTLDGRLVGDIGEVLAQQRYDLSLHPGLQHHHDGICSAGRQVQIKATMKDSVTFPCDHTPDYYIAVKIEPDGSLVEVFNGPGAIARQAISRRKASKTNLHSISLSALRKLQVNVNPPDRIPLRTRPAAADH